MSKARKLQDSPHRQILQIGGVVRRPTHPWSSAVHALLQHLEAVGFSAAPRIIYARDDEEALTFIPGESGPEGWAKVVDERGLSAAARLLRDYHQAVADWNPPTDLVWHDNSTGSGESDEIVCHGDFGPWNLVWEGVEPVGIIDWDYAAPATPLSDVAYAIEYIAPFRNDAECLRWLGYPEPPNRRHRLELFAHAYGLTSLDGLVDEVIQRQRDGLEIVRQLADRGLEPQVSWVAQGYLDALVDRITWSEEHRQLFA